MAFPPSIPGQGFAETRVVIQRDTKTNEEDYQTLLDIVSSAHVKLRNYYANKWFRSNCDQLLISENEVIEELIPLRIYRLNPDKNI